MKNVRLINIPIGSHLGLAMVGAQPKLQARSIDPHSSSWPPMTPIHHLKLWMVGALLDWMDGESTQPSNIEYWISLKNNLVDKFQEAGLGDSKAMDIFPLKY